MLEYIFRRLSRFSNCSNGTAASAPYLLSDLSPRFPLLRLADLMSRLALISFQFSILVSSSSVFKACINCSPPATPVCMLLFNSSLKLQFAVSRMYTLFSSSLLISTTLPNSTIYSCSCPTLCWRLPTSACRTELLVIRPASQFLDFDSQVYVNFLDSSSEAWRDYEPARALFRLRFQRWSYQVRLRRVYDDFCMEDFQALRGVSQFRRRVRYRSHYDSLWASQARIRPGSYIVVLSRLISTNKACFSRSSSAIFFAQISSSWLACAGLCCSALSRSPTLSCNLSRSTLMPSNSALIRFLSRFKSSIKLVSSLILSSLILLCPCLSNAPTFSCSWSLSYLSLSLFALQLYLSRETSWSWLLRSAIRELSQAIRCVVLLDVGQGLFRQSQAVRLSRRQRQLRRLSLSKLSRVFSLQRLRIREVSSDSSLEQACLSVAKSFLISFPAVFPLAAAISCSKPLLSASQSACLAQNSLLALAISSWRLSTSFLSMAIPPIISCCALVLVVALSTSTSLCACSNCSYITASQWFFSSTARWLMDWSCAFSYRRLCRCFQREMRSRPRDQFSLYKVRTQVLRAASSSWGDTDIGSRYARIYKIMDNNLIARQHSRLFRLRKQTSMAGLGTVREHTSIANQNSQKQLQQFKRLYEEQQQRIKALSIQLKEKDVRISRIERLLNLRQRGQQQSQQAQRESQQRTAIDNEYFPTRRKRAPSSFHLKRYCFETDDEDCRAEVSKQTKETKVSEETRVKKVMPLEMLRRIPKAEIIKRMRQASSAKHSQCEQ